MAAPCERDGNAARLELRPRFGGVGGHAPVDRVLAAAFASTSRSTASPGRPRRRGSA
jgi:hypothetical protein